MATPAQPNPGATPAPNPTPAGPPQFDISTLFSAGSGDLPEADDEENLDAEQNAPTQDNEPAIEAPPSQPSKPAVDVDTLAANQAEMTRALAALAQRSSQPAAPPTSEEPPKPRTWVTPEQIPAALQTLLNSEDPAERLQGLIHYGNALAHLVYNQFQQDVTQQYQPQFERLVQDRFTQQQQINAFKEEFAREYPVLVSNEQGRMVAQIVIQQVGQEFVAKGKQPNWLDPEFRQAFDAKLAAMKINAKGTPAKPVTPPAPTPSPRPAPVARSGGARIVDPAPGNSTQEDQMMAVLGTAFR